MRFDIDCIKEAVYKFSLLIGSGHQLDLFSSVGHFVHLSKNKSALLSIPKSNSKIVLLPLSNLSCDAAFENVSRETFLFYCAVCYNNYNKIEHIFRAG